METSIFASVLLLLGAIFSLIAALGILRFEDFYARIHAATKASTFGIGLIGVAAALAIGTPSAWVKMLFTVFFLFITLPIAAHLLGRSVLKSESERNPSRSADGSGSD